MKPNVRNLSMEQIVSSWPAVVPILINKGLKCVGCSMAAFDTVADAAREHKLNARELQTAIEKSIAKAPCTAPRPEPKKCTGKKKRARSST